ncbi:MAG: OmpH family outer membrane protein, partial [Prevotella fusca]
MKKSFGNMAVLAMAAFAFIACNNQPQKNDTTASKTETAAPAAASQKIAYIEIDSIMSQYTYWKDVTKLIKAKEANIQRTLAGKQKAIQAAAANFQQNIQANKYTQVQAQQIQASIQKQAQDADA